MSDADFDEDDAVSALERLGLSNYEARVFVALQRLGVGTAKEIHEVADVPRSQVYGAAESLEGRGLVELQQSTPKRYRPVDLDAAKRRLTQRIEREREQAFDYLASVKQEHGRRESRDDVWTVRGREPVSNRVAELVSAAESNVLFGTHTIDLVTDDIHDAVAERAAMGVDVTVLSEDPEVRDRFADVARVLAPPEGGPKFPGRILRVDDRAILLSVLSDSDDADESAIWSADSAIADVLIEISRGGIDSILDG